MFKVLVGIAAVAVTITSGLSIYDRVSGYMVHNERERVAAATAANAEASETRKRVGLVACDQPYWEYRRGLATDAVAKPRMDELRKTLADCNMKYGTGFSL